MSLVTTTDLASARAALQLWLGTKLPEAQNLEISELDVPTASGFSNETIFFDATWATAERGQSQRMVARVQTDGPGLYPVYDIGIQYRVMRTLAANSDIAVPKLLWMEEDPAVLGAPFFVMERLDGRVPGDDPPFTATGWVLDLPPSDRARLCDNALKELVRLHAVDCHRLDIDFLSRPELGDGPLEQEIAYYESYFNWASEGQDNPIIDQAFKWIRNNTPTAAGAVVLSWGDARIGNMMFGDDLSVIGVLDWEMASIAQPEQDLGWWLFMYRHHTEGFGLPHPEGFPLRGEVVARYEELSGRTVTDLEYYEVLAALRGAVIMVRLAHMMIDAGILPADSNMAVNNGSTRILADMIGLAAPEGAGIALISKS